VPPAARGFGLIPSATAGTLPAGFRAPPAIAGAQNAGGAWAVQVGAFASPDQARSAAQTAQSSVGGRVAVTSVQVGRSTLFRARVLGLNQGHAQQACDRLRARGGCTVLSPDAQG
jgi:cell division septation protein DedD